MRRYKRYGLLNMFSRPSLILVILNLMKNSKRNLIRHLLDKEVLESVEDIGFPPVSNDILTSSNNSVEKVESSNESDDFRILVN